LHWDNAMMQQVFEKDAAAVGLKSIIGIPLLLKMK
jgi:hypothetical protein